SLREYGYNVFLDLDNINEGRFKNTIVDAIYNCTYFIALLGHNSLDSEWVCREIRHALDFDRTIIPVLIDDYQLDERGLPDELKSLAAFNGPRLNAEFYEASLERLANNFLRSVATR
ncbi:MAG TPA: toll/interleukin-1 receptor domain-containing protein, partial [Phototrophicaceae bacterium]|nr:toll/interleukin-1 receptor domain-containing protein [Phototrophicaceae bacterium]